MQLSVHYREEDKYLIDQLEKRADRKRMSKSAMLLNILEEHFEAEKRVGQILKDMRAVDEEQVQQALARQRETEEDKRIGRIMVEKGYVEEDQLNRALEVQAASGSKNGPSGPKKKKQ